MSTLQSDFKEALRKAQEYIQNKDIPTCVVHHIKENVSFDELKYRVEKCRNDYVDRDELEETLKDLARLGAVYNYLDGTYNLTRLGDRLVGMIDKNKISSHAVRI